MIFWIKFGEGHLSVGTSAIGVSGLFYSIFDTMGKPRGGGAGGYTLVFWDKEADNSLFDTMHNLVMYKRAVVEDRGANFGAGPCAPTDIFDGQ